METSARPVLVATDLSGPADEALLQGHARAARTNCRLVVCCVVPNLVKDDPAVAPLNVQLASRTEPLRSQAAQTVVERVAAVTGRTADDFTLIVDDGVPASIIVHEAEALDAGLVVVGASGTTPSEDGLGHVAEAVIRHAHCPVLVARPHAATNRILVATDFSDPSLPAVEAAVRESRATGSALTILHSVELGTLLTTMASGPVGVPIVVTESLVLEARAHAEEKLGEALRSFEAQGETLVAEGAPDAAILDAAAERDADLVVIGTIGKSGLRRLLLGSVAESVVRGATCSVLVVRLHRERLLGS